MIFRNKGKTNITKRLFLCCSKLEAHFMTHHDLTLNLNSYADHQFNNQLCGQLQFKLKN